MIHPKDFGKDHWSLLGYFDTLAMDNQPIDERRVRCNPQTHPKHNVGNGWKDEYGTRLSGYFLEEGKKDESRLLLGHDDWDCKEDLIAAGYLFDTLDLAATFTAEGRRVMDLLRKHKETGGFFSNFSLFPKPEAPKKQSTNHKELRTKQPIRRGQRWRKKDAGLVMTISHRDTDDCWKVIFDSHSRRATHTLKARDIQRYYEPVS